MSLADETRWMDATAQAELVRTGQVAASELVDAAIERIERFDGALNAVIHRRFDRARDEATTPGNGPFAGVPFLVKDLWATAAGDPISNGNVALRDAGYVAPADTWLIERYRRAGLVTVGRTNTPELGSVATTEPISYGPTHNPWDLARTPGGSSGGSTAAVAAGLVPVAHASDGGGSIRIPAALCGLVGLKPSRGRITLGPLRDETVVSVEHVVSRSVRDSATLLDLTAGPGTGDATIAPRQAGSWAEAAATDPAPLRVGWWSGHPRGFPVDPDCAAAVDATARLLESLGHHVAEAHPAPLDDPAASDRFGLQWAVMMATSLRVLGGWIGRELTEADVEPMNWELARMARAVSAIEYAEMQAAHGRYRREVAAWWRDGWDLLLTPTTAAPAWPLGEIVNNADSPLAPFAISGQRIPYTAFFNVTGQPAISLPLHQSATGLPIGVHLVAAYGREDLLLQVAGLLERAAPWAGRRPPDPA